MKRNRKLILASIVTVVIFAVPTAVEGQDTTTQLNQHLAQFEPMVGKTWRGEFASSTEEKPVIDIARWERALNGNAIRVLHSVNDGEYGGESILMWDPKQERIASWYFTTAGFFTQATFEITDKTWTAVEEVTGNANGITQVKSITQLLDNGEMHVKSEYYANGQWQPGHEIRYRQVTDAEVKFK